MTEDEVSDTVVEVKVMVVGTTVVDSVEMIVKTVVVLSQTSVSAQGIVEVT